MTSDTIITTLAALLASLLICLFIWPKKNASYQDYINVLDFSAWKNYDQIYVEVRKLSKRPISENEHEHTLSELESSGTIESRIFEPETADEIIYTTIILYEYRLVHNGDDGGTPIRKHKKIPLIQNFLPSPI